MEVIHITCNMCSRDLPDMYALSPRACGPQASGIHIRQIPRAHVTIITYTPVMAKFLTTIFILFIISTWFLIITGQIAEFADMFRDQPNMLQESLLAS